MNMLNRTAAFAALALTTGYAEAQSDETPTAGASPEWRVVLGGGAIYQPKYEGSDETEVVPVPFVMLQYGRFRFGPEALEYQLWRGPSAALGLTLGYDGGRDPEDIDSGVLDGLATIEGAARIGANFDYDLGAFSLGEVAAFAELEHSLGGSDGTTLELGLRTRKHLNARFSIHASAAATVSDSKYMGAYFGISAADAAASGYSVYEAGAGLHRVDIGLGATYLLGDHWLLRGEMAVGKLLGDAADSPIVLDDVQPSVVVAVGYRF